MAAASTAAAAASTAYGPVNNILEAGAVEVEHAEDVPAGGRASAAFANPQMQPVEWWLNRSLYYILQNRLYYLLGAGVADSEGEDEWYGLLGILRVQGHWCHARGW